jgi:triosephosphate isomerase
MSRVKICVLNLKNKVLYSDAKDYSKKLSHFDSKYKLILAPGDAYLPVFSSGKYDLCAQDISQYDFVCTGEVGANTLKSLNAKYVLVGHLERRKLYDDEYVIEKKIKNALKSNLKVIYFIGEESRLNGFFLKELLKTQIRNVLDYVEPNDRDNILIAYEPGWLIGKEDTLLDEDIESISTCIKDYVYKKYLYEPKVLYGLSVNNESAKELLDNDSLDGIVLSPDAQDLEKAQDILK